MVDRPWRTWFGLLAVILWSIVIGIPVLLFHLNDFGMNVGEHVHALFMFFASQALVFWLAARSRPKSTTAPSQQPSPVTNPFANVPAAEPVWAAELATGSMDRPLGATTDSPIVSQSPIVQRQTTKLIVGNYIASSRTRIAYVEPGGIQRALLPGQELEITAVSQGRPPSFRIIESDQATQIYVEGPETSVVLTERNGSALNTAAATPDKPEYSPE